MADGVSSRTPEVTTSRGRGKRGRGSASGRATGERWRRIFLRARSVAQGTWGQVVVPFGSGFLLGRAVIFDTLHPFGTAYVVALAAVGHRRRGLIAAGGVLLAAATASPGTSAGESAPVLILVWFLATLVGRLFDLPSWVSAAGAMLGATTLRVVAAAFGGEELLSAALVGVVDMSGALALLPVAARLFGRRGPTNEGKGPSPQTQYSNIDSAYSASLLLFISLLLLGTHGIRLGDYSLHALLTRLLVLLAAAAGGVGPGAIAGTLLGLLTLLGTGSLVWEASLFAAAGLAAGLGSTYGRPGAFTGMLIAHLVLSSYARGGHEIAMALTHCLLAGVLLTGVPRPLLRKWRSRLEFVMAGSVARRHGRAAASALHDRLQRFAEVFEQAAAVFAGDQAAAAAFGLVPVSGDHGFGRQDGPTSGPDARGQAGVAPDKPQYGLGAGIQADETALFDQFIENVFKTVCRGCSHQSVCWDTYAYQTYRDLLTIAADAAASFDGKTGPTFEPRHLPAGLRQRCIKPQYFAPGVDRLLVLMRERVRRQEHVRKVHAPMQRQLTGIADIITGVAQELTRIEMRSREAARHYHPPRFQLQTDYVHVPGDNSAVSGDAFQRVDLTDGRVAFIVCDGMGSGPRAAVESKAVVAMLRRFLEAGFDLHFCVQTINAVMLLRATEESFVTVDVSVVDLKNGAVRMLKTGAAPTFIHRGNNVEMVRADSLPVGILPSVDVYEAEGQLHLGDVLIMMSDGGLDLGNPRGDKAEAVRQQMQRLERPRPRQVVDSLFARAHRTTGQRLPDDVTIVAAQLVPAVIASV